MFIKDSFAISPQLTFNEGFEKDELVIHEAKVYQAIEPNYLEFVPASLLRRMGKAVRMGIGAGMPLIKKHRKNNGIIIGTANGGLENCIHFLNQIVDFEEGLLTPTHFVQSTPNAVAGQLALLSENTGYNVTHVNGALSFENALLDGMMFLENLNEPAELLIGAVEEISDYNYNIDTLAGFYKKDLVSNDKLLQTKTDGSVCGEGSSMFVCSNESTGSIAEIIAIEQLTFPEYTDLELKIDVLLQNCNLTKSDIDVVLLGNNGDIRQDHWYDFLSETILPESTAVSFKNLVGDYRTVSSFATYLAVQFFQGKNLSLINPKSKSAVSPKYILIYNHFNAVRHGIIVLRKTI